MDTEKTLTPFVLIADDDEDLLQLIQSKLKSEGFRVAVSPNGDNIFDMIHDALPDIILLDIHMDGVDGGTLCHLLRFNKSTAHIPIFMFSANDNISVIADQCGATGFIEKPFDLSLIKNTLLNAKRISA